MTAESSSTVSSELVLSEHFQNVEQSGTCIPGLFRGKLQKTVFSRNVASIEKDFIHKTSASNHVANSVSLDINSSAESVSRTELFHTDDFFDASCETLAKALLGKVLVRRLDDGTVLKGRIVETECYLGEEDRASHSYGGRRTERNAPMYMKPGTSYVYLTYGMYHCFNISSRGPGAAVLVRALEPLEGLEAMAALRLAGAKQQRRPLKKKALKPEELCSGPAKLCLAMAIDRDTCNKRDLGSWGGLRVASRPSCGGGEETGRGRGQQQVVVATKRIGIESAGPEWADKPLRFYLLGNRFVSKRDKAKERQMMLADGEGQQRGARAAPV